jgi:hypothetical protein
MDENNIPSFHDVENEPTPYGFNDVPATPTRKSKTGGGAKRHRVAIATGVGCVLFTCSIVGFLIIRRALTPPAGVLIAASTPNTSLPITPAPEGTSAITIGIQKSANGVRLFVQWNELPNGTADIDIFYSSSADGIYRLIGSIPVPSSISGNGYLTIPSEYQNGYYYGTATSGDGSPLWSSSSTTPVDGGNPPPASDGQGTNSSTPGNDNQPPQNGSGDNDGSSTTGDNGTQGNVTSTGQASSSAPGDNFMVQHNNGKIQISWQSLPASTFHLVISRSASDTDPWAAVLTETNIVTDGPYSILIGDDTLGDQYYYKMDAYDASGTDIATFGPTLLSPL